MVEATATYMLHATYYATPYMPHQHKYFKEKNPTNEQGKF